MKWFLLSLFLNVVLWADGPETELTLRDRLALNVNGMSYHFKGNRDVLNEENVGLGFAYYLKTLETKFSLFDEAKLSVGADVYSDSFSSTGIALYGTLRKPLVKRLDYGVSFGVVHEDHLDDAYGLYFHPYAAPFLETTFDGPIDFRLTLIPPVRNGGFLVLQMLVPWGKR
jgi:hypothetical protein